MMFASPFGRIFSPPFEPNSLAVAAGGDWWLAGGIDPADCVAAYRAKGAASLAASYVNLNNPGTYDLSGATPDWSASLGYTSYVAFTTNIPLPPPCFVLWCGRVDGGSYNWIVSNPNGNWDGIAMAGPSLPGDSKIYISYAVSTAGRIAYTATAYYGATQVIGYAKNDSLNEGYLYMNGSYKTKNVGLTDPTETNARLLTGGYTQFIAASFYSAIPTDAQILAVSTAMAAL